MPKTLPIHAISVIPEIGLIVCPSEGSNLFQYIYRTATGVRWNEEHRGFVAYEPERWEHSKLFQNIQESVANELGIRLLVDDKTKWDPLLKLELQEI